MTTSVLVPYRAEQGSQRERIWQWMLRRWMVLMPDVQLIAASDGQTSGPFNEGEAYHRAASMATGDVFVLAEAETAFNARSLRSAVDGVRADGGWRIAEDYYMLNREATERVLAGPPDALLTPPLGRSCERVYHRESVGPIIVVPADVFRSVGGFDARYNGWGWTDKSFAYAANTLYQPFTRYPGATFHLWHPREPVFDANPDLTRQYREADGDPVAMQALTEHR